MTHPLVEQLRFTRQEWQRGLRGVSASDALLRLGPNPMNSIACQQGRSVLFDKTAPYWPTSGRATSMRPGSGAFAATSLRT